MGHVREIVVPFSAGTETVGFDPWLSIWIEWAGCVPSEHVVPHTAIQRFQLPGPWRREMKKCPEFGVSVQVAGGITQLLVEVAVAAAQQVG